VEVLSWHVAVYHADSVSLPQILLVFYWYLIESNCLKLSTFLRYHAHSQPLELLIYFPMQAAAAPCYTMQDRLDTFYDRISDLEERISDVNEKINSAMSEQLSSKQLCNILTHFDKIYDKMPDIEKKRFMRDFVESIELFPECQENGSLLKHIDFKFPVSYNVEDASIVLPTGNDVETVVRFSPSSEI